MDVELDGTNPVYAETTQTVTVNSATDNGYMLSAYVDDNENLYLNGNTEDETHKISSLSTNPSTLLDNTWGMATTDPEDQTSKSFRGLPVGQDNAMPLKITATSTPENDETTIYYATYLTPELVGNDGYGTYSGITINYIATAYPDTSDNDVIVNYKGNGLYFDEEQTKEENTVVYGDSCSIAYLGGNCTTAYKANEPYARYYLSDFAGSGSSIPITIDGADKVSVTVDYDTTEGESCIVIVRGRYTFGSEVMPEEYRVIYPGQGQETITFNGDTVSILVPSTDHISKADFEVYPVYNEAPEGIETTPFSVCNIVKSGNVDADGTKKYPYGNEGGGEAVDKVSIPGASSIRVELDYAFTGGTADLMIVQGEWRPGYAPLTQYEKIEPNENIRGNKTITYIGDTVTFYYDLDDGAIDGYDDGFYAKIYPIYEEEKDGTTPVEECKTRRKSGEYKEPVSWQGKWRLQVSENSFLYFRDEQEAMDSMIQNREFIRQMLNDVVDLYAYDQ